MGGRPMFVLAKTPHNGFLNAITVTCNLHVHGGRRCNKSLTLGGCFSEEEAVLENQGVVCCRACLARWR